MNNKTFTIEQILALKQALETAGFGVSKNVELEAPGTFALGVSGTVKLSGKRFAEKVVVSFVPIMVDCYTKPQEPARGGIIFAVNRVPGYYVHPEYKTFRAFDVGKIVAEVVRINTKLERDAEWDIMWAAWVKAKREKHYSDTYKTRFLRKYAEEHFPDHYVCGKSNKSNKK